MRGKVFAVRKLLLLPVLALGATPVAADDLVAPASAVIVLDASARMAGNLGTKKKLDTIRQALSKKIAEQGQHRALGLVAFGHSLPDNCSDIEALAEPGALQGANAAALFDKVEAKGKAPVASAISSAALLAASENPLNIVLVAGGGDNCDADPCAAVQALKQKYEGLRINVVGLSESPADIQSLACMANATGGKFVAATNETGFDVAVGAVFGALDEPPAPAAVAGEGRTTSSELNTENTAESVIPVFPPEPVPEAPAEPVAIQFHALATEGGAKLRSGLIWRVYKATPKADGGFELISTHREAAPNTELLPGEYLVNAAYGLSNLTKKVQVHAGARKDEAFVLNTGGLSLNAILASGEECPESEVEFDIQSDEQDQFGKRETILADAKPNSVIRLNAGAYHIKSLYGDANANVGVDVTVEPGKVTNATIKHTGAKITFRLVQSRGGEALADTKWQVLTSAGDSVKANVGALPTHILAAGNYAVVAEHGGKSYSRKFEIEPGEDKQVEVAIEDGAISDEELQALLDPPEAPRPGTGGLAGEGPGGFDGFSKPADPNAPLLNPGALLRPSR